jgi:hypothetical protein
MRRVSGAEGAGRNLVQLKLLRAVWAWVRTLVRAVKEPCSGRRGLMREVEVSFLVERCE